MIGPVVGRDLRLDVTADLRLDVTAPDGTRTTVLVHDGDDALLVDIGDLGVLRRSLPGGTTARGLIRAVRALEATGVPLAAWRQDVEVALRGRALLERRRGRWRPAGVLGAGVRAAAALVAVSVVVGVVAAVRGRSGT